jgi:hypothetical protein
VLRIPRRSLTASAVACLLLFPLVAAAQNVAPAPPAPAAPVAPSAASPPAPSPALASTPAAASAASPSAAPSSPSSSPSANPDLQRELDALREEIHSLQAEVKAAHAPTAPPSVPPPPPRLPRPLGYESFWPWILPPEGISTGGYFQSQYETHQNSQDQIAQGGALLNQNRFSIRRARVHVNGEWEYAAVALELDANTTNGPQVDLHKAEVSLQYRPDRTRPPIVMATMGQFDTPFGYELPESPRTRWFMERSKGSLAMWPSEPDIGLRLAGALAFFRWTIAGLNGNPLGSGPFQLEDPIAAKDVLFRFGFDASPRKDWQLAGGVSSIRGKGFHSGTDATSSSIQWIDLNGDNLVQPNEIQPVIAQVAKPSQTFDRWAVNVDFRTSFQWWLGVLKVYGELTVAKNYDRGLFIADPIVTGVDQREFAYYVAVVQEVTRYAVVGFRYDYYDPNADLFDTRAGQLIPYSEALRTYSPLVGLLLPDRARFLVQYDINRNAFARNAVGVPTNLQDNALFLRLQVEL